ncbi:MAG: hypothetical protein HYT98_04460 [Candidatus Sungbacteria bacterium]|nr:hypothetical protein [Candidatus Sungbacteria bacterium]
MKFIVRVIEVVRDLPEEARRLIAGIILVIAAIFMFFSWGASTSSRLADLSGGEVSPVFDVGGGVRPISPEIMAELPSGAREAVGPLAGIAESVKSSAEFLSSRLRYGPPQENGIGAGWNFGRIKNAGRAIKNAASIVAGEFSERTYNLLKPFLSGEGGAF